jgi:hypothetical protein
MDGFFDSMLCHRIYGFGEKLITDQYCLYFTGSSAVYLNSLLPLGWSEKEYEL